MPARFLSEPCQPGNCVNAPCYMPCTFVMKDRRIHTALFKKADDQR